MRRAGITVVLVLAVMVFATCTRESGGTAAAEQQGDAGPILQAGGEKAAVAGEAERPAVNEAAAQPAITFESTEFDFGEVDQGEDVEHIFTFRNTGNGELIIENVRSS